MLKKVVIVPYCWALCILFNKYTCSIFKKIWRNYNMLVACKEYKMKVQRSINYHGHKRKQLGLNERLHVNRKTVIFAVCMMEHVSRASSCQTSLFELVHWSEKSSLYSRFQLCLSLSLSVFVNLHLPPPPHPSWVTSFKLSFLILNVLHCLNETHLAVQQDKGRLDSKCGCD